MDEYDIDDDEGFFHALLCMLDDYDDGMNQNSVYWMELGAMNDDVMEAACRCWEKFHDMKLTFFVAHFVKPRRGSFGNAKDMRLFYRFIVPCKKAWLPSPGAMRVFNYITDNLVVPSILDNIDDKHFSNTYNALVSAFPVDGEAEGVLDALGFDTVHAICKVMNPTMMMRTGASIAMVLRFVMDLDDERHVAWVVSLLRLANKAEYSTFPISITHRNLQRWLKDGMMDLPVEFFMESYEAGGVYHERAKEAVQRFMDIECGNGSYVGALEHSAVSAFLSVDVSATMMKKWDPVVESLMKLPDDIIRCMALTHTDNMVAMLNCGIFVYSPLDSSGAMPTVHLHIMKRIASHDDNDVWYRWAVFANMQYYFFKLFREPSSRKCRIYDLPSGAWDWIENGVMPAAMTYHLRSRRDEEVRSITTDSVISLREGMKRMHDFPATFDDAVSKGWDMYTVGTLNKVMHPLFFPPMTTQW
jgi:hypothetical protein